MRRKIDSADATLIKSTGIDVVISRRRRAYSMSSLAELPKISGFFSYSREDDEGFKGRLSNLRDAIQRELSAQLGLKKENFRLFQDKEAIAPGKLWEKEIAKAIGEAVFFIPIVTPRAVSSPHCKYEFESFLARERALGRDDLVFPILYRPVKALKSSDDPVLSILRERQNVDWHESRHLPVDAPEISELINYFCGKIAEALQERQLTPGERRMQEVLGLPIEEINEINQRREVITAELHEKIFKATATQPPPVGPKPGLTLEEGRRK